MAAPEKILWSERDSGEKLSIIMASFFMLVVTGLMGFVGARAALKGEWIEALPAVGFVGVVVKLWFDWRERNAR